MIQLIVVYLYIPTSNHNREKFINGKSYVVYLYIPTSNHNRSLQGGEIL